MNILKFILNYFAEKFTPFERYLHYSILILVLVQILISDFIEISDDGVIGGNIIESSATWMHIGIGLTLLLLAVIFIVLELKKHGILYFYPYLSGDFAQLKSDINALKKLALPEVSPKGLAAIIQGLGLGALLLVTLSGATWLLLWFYDSSLANDVKELHELLTGLIEAYVIGHGGIGLLHMLITYKTTRMTDK